MDKKEKSSKCEHENIKYDKINDYNYCEDCMKIFVDNQTLLFLEEETKNDIIDEVENNLKELNNL